MLEVIKHTAQFIAKLNVCVIQGFAGQSSDSSMLDVCKTIGSAGAVLEVVVESLPGTYPFIMCQRVVSCIIKHFKQRSRSFLHAESFICSPATIDTIDARLSILTLPISTLSDVGVNLPPRNTFVI